MIGNIRVRIEKYDEALGTTTGTPMADCHTAAAQFGKNLADLLWSPEDFRGHNIGGMGPNMLPICELRLGNLVDQVKKVFPIATNVPGTKRYPRIPKFLSMKLNRHFRIIRYNENQGNSRLVFLYIFFFANASPSDRANESAALVQYVHLEVCIVSY